MPGPTKGARRSKGPSTLESILLASSLPDTPQADEDYLRPPRLTPRVYQEADQPREHHPEHRRGDGVRPVEAPADRLLQDLAGSLARRCVLSSCRYKSVEYTRAPSAKGCAHKRVQETDTLSRSASRRAS